FSVNEDLMFSVNEDLIYCLVITDDYSIFSWVFFLASKDETPSILKTFIIGIENLLSLKVKIIRCDNGTEFKNADLNQFCGLKGIKMEFSIPRTPQQNGIAERKNRTLIEAARTLLADLLLPIPFWAEAVNTAGYVQNQANFKGRLMKDFILDTLSAARHLEYLIVEPVLFRRLCMFPRHRKRRRGRNSHICAFFVLSDGSTNSQNNNKDAHVDGKDHDDDIQKYVSLDFHSSGCGDQTRKQGDKTENKDKGKSLVVTITGFRDLNVEFEECNNNSSNGVNAASSSVFAVGQNCINSTNDFSDAGPSNAAMPNLDDLSQNADDVGAEADINNMESIILVRPIPTTRIHKDRPTSQIIGDLSSTTQTRSMARAVRDQGFPVYQMDVKSAFLYGTIEEEVYVCQPPGFEDPEYPDKVYKVVKALYGLHQAPRAWYETLATYLLENVFQRGTIDQTLFIKKQQKDILLVQIDVDDIIFGVINKALCQSFKKLIKDKFQMSSMGELTLFLGLQVKQKKDGIFISKDKYVAEILRKFGLSQRKSASTLIDVEKPLLKDSDGEDVDVYTYRSMIGSLMYLTSSRLDIMFADSPFDLVAYSDSDYAGASLDRKSITGGCQFLRCRLISWQCKKQTVVATSSTEAEYVAAASGCAQVL
nr:putative ribonuclease H-like domain-containing protein [Tanacetum cinerariifolium]